MVDVRVVTSAGRLREHAEASEIETISSASVAPGEATLAEAFPYCEPGPVLFSEEGSAEAVVASFAETEDPRLRGVLTSLVHHLHAFVKDVELTEAEWATAIDFLGNPSLNLWAVLVAASWRHVGYVMVLYLAGLKSVDPTLREAAAIDGANARQTFIRVVFPVMKPINVVVIVVTVIESLRAFDIVYIINKGKNVLELLSTLITNNTLTEASLVGFGSAIAVVLLLLSLVPIIFFLTRTMRSDTR